MGSSLRKESCYLGSWFQKGYRASWEEAMQWEPESHIVYGERKLSTRGEKKEVGVAGGGELNAVLSWLPTFLPSVQDAPT